MKKTQKNILSTLTLLSLSIMSNGCVAKNADGSYNSAYSYHPYVKSTKKYQASTQINRNVKHIRSKIKINPPIKHVVNNIQLNRFNNPHLSSTNHIATKINFNRFNDSDFSPKNHLANNIESVAKSLLGTDYQYGANGPYQYDCSSFTKYVFSKNGITLPRVSRDQAKVGQLVNASDLQKGDLIFFNSKKSTKVAHVGIYLGEGNFIHASSAKDQVTISNLKSNYYSKHFKWGRRVTNMQHYARR